MTVCLSYPLRVWKSTMVERACYFDMHNVVMWLFEIWGNFRNGRRQNVGNHGSHRTIPIWWEYHWSRQLGRIKL
jgi:hypothetical protein